MRRRRLLLEAAQEAGQFAEGVRLNVDPADAIQQILDNMMMAYNYSLEKMFTLTEDEYFEDTITGKRINPWIAEQERLALQVTHIAGKAAAMGLAERVVRLQEQQAAIFATIVEAALNAAGIDAEDRRKVHEGIAIRMEDIEGTAHEVKTIGAGIAA